MRSVYLGMFEQTLLTHTYSGRKTGALAASFVAQSAVGGVLLIGPLLYTQALPLMRALPPAVPIYTPPPPAPPQVVRAETAAASSAATLGGPRRAFVPPRTVPTGPIRTGPVEAGTIEFAGVVTTAVEGVPSLLPGVISLLPPSPEPTASTPAPPADPPKLIRLSEGVLKGKLLTMVRPAYPAIAKQARVSGTVRLLGIVGRDGRVRELRVVDGPAMLRQAAYDAVIQWVYSPTMLSGSPVEVEAPIEVNFRLN